MISPTSFTIESIQAVAYVAGDGLRPSAVLRHLLQHYGDVYDGEPIAVPYVDGMPPEVPTAILPSQDGAWRADISRMSLSLLWNRTPDSTVGNLHRTYHSFAERLGSIFDTTQSRVGRLGAVIIRSAPVSDPGKALAEQFCRDEWLHGPLNRPEGLELHAHKVFQLREDLPVNSWMRIRSQPDSQQTYRFVVVLQDINTLATELHQRHFDKAQIAAVYATVSDELDHVFDLYFPSA